MNRKPTEDEIVETLAIGLSDEDVDSIKLTQYKDLIRLHHGLGTYIRNTYRLWDIPWTPKIKNGVDHASDHPDAISMRIIYKLHAKLNGTIWIDRDQ